MDLFSGCGGMSLGLSEAARRAGWDTEIALAVDLDGEAAAVYEDNFPGARVLVVDVAALFPGQPGDPITREERHLAEEIGRVDILVAGPPCQGHSDLNNHTRRDDPKNALYLLVARAAEVLGAAVVLIENVPSSRRDKGDVVGSTTAALLKAGYRVHGDVVDASRLGLPQARRRFLLVASVASGVDPAQLLGEITAGRRRSRDLAWAIGDLAKVESDQLMDTPSPQSAVNRRRVAYLFNNGVDDLPNAERPPCHREKLHSYKAMYGRLRWDRPAPTITTGFTSMGQGRYVHPSQRRTITPHEAARIQTFPDWFSWKRANGRTALARMIGNAVPPLLMMSVGRLLLRRGIVRDDGLQRETRRATPPSTPVVGRRQQAHEGRPSARHQARGSARGRARPSRARVREAGPPRRRSTATS